MVFVQFTRNIHYLVRWNLSCPDSKIGPYGKVSKDEFKFVVVVLIGQVGLHKNNWNEDWKALHPHKAGHEPFVTCMVHLIVVLYIMCKMWLFQLISDR